MGGGDSAFITINLKSSARSAWPHEATPSILDELKYDVTLTGPTGTHEHTIAPGEKSKTFTVAEGKWDVKLDAYHNNEHYATGSSITHVRTGQNSAVTLQMNKVICANGHSFTEWGETTAATCLDAAINTEKCDVCGALGEETDEGHHALGHLVNSWDWTTYNSSNGHVSCKRLACSGGLAAIGDTGPAGGIIFYVVSNGFTIQGYSGGTGSFAAYTAYYLEAAPANEGSSIPWSENTHGAIIADATAFSSLDDIKASLIGNGRRDTQIIVNYLATQGETGKAAQVCANKSLNGFTDWFLPSLGELNEMYKAKGQTGIPTTGEFWSSSQNSNQWAYSQYFVTGQMYSPRRELNCVVRAIRAF